MKTEKFIISNLKCGGCANTIQSKVTSIKGVQDVYVNQEEGAVTIQYEGAITRDLFAKKLKDLGYPEATDENGFFTQLKSFASCVIGRMSGKKSFTT